MKERGTGTCRLCGRNAQLSSTLGICRNCIIEDDRSVEMVREIHIRNRRRLGLTVAPPKRGVACGRCANDCRIPEGEVGYCGVRWNRNGKIEGLPGEEAVASAYHDPLPTNCVAGWVCPECEETSASGRFPSIDGYGFNLAVFYGACTFDCLFCQNWQYKEMTTSLQPRMSVSSLGRMAGPSTRCVCYFGGDPTPFIGHTERMAVTDRVKGNERRHCWETNGSMSTGWMRRIGEIAMESGGCVKVDIKAFDERLNIALCGSSNKQTLSNLDVLSSMGKERGGSPLLIVSTPLVPGYVTEEEVLSIAGFLAELDPSIPYSLLGFHPAHMMSDLPVTSRKHADACVKAAKEAGLKNVHVGNEWMLR